MKVKVTDGYQINVAGKVHRGGDVLEATNAEAAPWVAAGWAKEAKEEKSKEVQKPQSDVRAQSKEVQRPQSGVRPSNK